MVRKLSTRCEWSLTSPLPDDMTATLVLHQPLRTAHAGDFETEAMNSCTCTGSCVPRKLCSGSLDHTLGKVTNTRLSLSLLLAAAAATHPIQSSSFCQRMSCSERFATGERNHMVACDGSNHQLQHGNPGTTVQHEQTAADEGDRHVHPMLVREH